jgi:hypothetical protein
MQFVDIKGKKFSKIICGSNPFYGHSHFSEAKDKEYLNRFNDEYIIKVIQSCLSKGVNTIESSANERIWSLISSFQSDSKIQFIGSTRIDETSPIRSHQKKLKYLLDIKADACVIHAQFVDRPRKSDEIKGLKSLIDQIHEYNLIAGISTHKISTVETCEKMNYGIDFYLFPLNSAGIVYPGYDGTETVQDRINLIQNISKPFIIMKALASGRIRPCEGLPFVLENIKENDLITLGLGSTDEVEESLRIVEQYYKERLEQDRSS